MSAFSDSAPDPDSPVTAPKQVMRKAHLRCQKPREQSEPGSVFPVSAWIGGSAPLPIAV